MRRALLLSAALCLAGCGDRADPPAVARAAEGADGAPAVKSGPFDVTERGVGPLGSATRFTADAVRAAYPDAEVRRQVFQIAENSEPTLRADAADGTALEVFGDASGGLSTVVVLGGPFKGPGGETLLQPWAETGFRREQCRAGEGRWLNAAVCRRPESSAVQVVFAVPGWTGRDLADETTLRERGKVSAFVWTASGR